MSVAQTPKVPDSVRLTAEDRRATLIQRSWTRSERRVVLRGFFGRLAIAIEPVICGTLFAGLTIGLMIRREFFLAPIFALGLVAFAIYAVWMLVKPTRALLATMAPIYIVDGYLRLRPRDESSEDPARGYVAVLSHDRSIVHEWPFYGEILEPDQLLPAMVEFSDFGGIHKIDGRSTGAIPERMPVLGVGLNRRH